MEGLDRDNFALYAKSLATWILQRKDKELLAAEKVMDKNPDDTDLNLSWSDAETDPILIALWVSWNNT